MADFPAAEMSAAPPKKTLGGLPADPGGPVESARIAKLIMLFMTRQVVATIVYCL